MKTLRPILAVLILATVFAAVWFLLLDDSSALPSNAEPTDSDLASDQEPLSIPKPNSAPLVKPETIDDVVDTDASDKPVPDKVTDFEPNYGQLLQRGGGIVSFELFDANDKRVTLGKDPISLRRIFGDNAIIDACHYKDNRIVCEGLGHHNTYTGLEPGEYELTFKSGKWGNMRQRFHVAPGEQRIERLQSKHYERVVCFYFVDQDGQPVKWIPVHPKVTSESKALPRIGSKSPDARFLTSRPDKTPPFGGMGWGSSGSRTRYLRESEVWYETEDGRFYFKVWAGATNTVTFDLDNNFWGTDEFTVTDIFIDSRWELHQVTLQIAEDFGERIESHLKRVHKVKVHNPADEPSPSVDTSRQPKLDPETATIRPNYGRVIVTDISPEGLKPRGKWQAPQRHRIHKFKLTNGQWFCDFPLGGSIYIRAEGKGLTTTWQKVVISDGQITYAQIHAPTTSVNLDSSTLSPTLNAAALVLELQLNRRIAVSGHMEIVEEPSPMDEGSTWAKSPAGTAFLKRFRFTKTAGQYGYSQYINPAKPFSDKAFDRFGYRTILRTAARHRPRSGSASSHPSGRMYFDPITLKSPWTYLKGDGQTLLQKLQDGDIKPSLEGVFAFRAVGENQEGLPWVQGILMPLENEELALAVKVRMESASDGNVPSLDNKVMNEYAAELAAMDEVEESESTSALKKLIGEDNYKLFENDEQRLWFANNGSWYNSHMKVFSDDHGYVLTRQHKLEEGKNYVLYLWSSSRDQMKPDKRVVFKAVKNNTDLGVIRLPSYR